MKKQGTFFQYWWKNAKLLVFFGILGIVSSTALYLKQETMWWFFGTLTVSLNIIYFIGLYTTWKRL